MYYMNKVNNERIKTERRISGVVDDMEDEALLSGKDNINKTNVTSGNLTSKVSHPPKHSPLMTFFIMMKHSFAISW
jgi:hypothetical protein